MIDRKNGGRSSIPPQPAKPGTSGYSVGNALYDIVTNKPGYLAPGHLASSRLQICKSCTFFDPLFRRCKDCGCQVDMKTKLAGAYCPRNKW